MATKIKKSSTILDSTPKNEESPKMATTIKKFQTILDPTPKDVGVQTWDENPTFIMKGKKINIKDYVQENAVGTTFYENLERFGNEQSAIEFMNINRAEIVGDFKEAIKLEDLENRRNELKNIWANLPAKIRDEKFENNFQNFMNNGNKFIDEEEQILIQENTKNAEMERIRQELTAQKSEQETGEAGTKNEETQSK